MNDTERDGLQEIIDNALADMARAQGDSFDLDHVNLAELSRRTGLSRSKVRTLKAKGFKVLPHGRCGIKAQTSVMHGFEGVVDGFLGQGVTNSEVIFDRIADLGYKGGKTSVKNYIAEHNHLVPAKRKLSVEPRGNRGRRFTTEPGEAFQMDWGFVDAVDVFHKLKFSKITEFSFICHGAIFSVFTERQTAVVPFPRHLLSQASMMRPFFCLGR